MPTLFGLKTCDTCRKAAKALEAAGKNIEFHDVREQPLSEEVLRRFLDFFGEDLVNRRSTTWRNLSDDAQSRPSLLLLIEHPTLMKRPVIEDVGELSLGWDKALQARLLV